MSLNFTGQTALITGASSGLGVEFARVLAARGANLVLVARRSDRLEALAAELRTEFGRAVTPYSLDLTRSGVGAELHQALAERNITIQTLINNAGFGTHGSFVDEDSARIANEIQLDVAAVVDLARTFLPDLLAAGTGALVNVASTAGFQPLPGMAVYGASKAFVLSFTEAIAHETRASGLKVIALCPGATETEFFDVVGTKDAAVGALQTPEQVIATAMRALDARRTPAVVISGRVNMISSTLVRLVPRRVAVALAARAVAGSAHPEPAAGDISARVGA
ncbi:SDR family NAD(P)-dependent oxidoreductase [Subtercola lobariae]|nr:SDR family oxidoreductase [Subtercola lobariae]